MEIKDRCSSSVAPPSPLPLAAFAFAATASPQACIDSIVSLLESLQDKLVNCKLSAKGKTPDSATQATSWPPAVRTLFCVGLHRHLLATNPGSLAWALRRWKTRTMRLSRWTTRLAFLAATSSFFAAAELTPTPTRSKAPIPTAAYVAGGSPLKLFRRQDCPAGTSLCSDSLGTAFEGVCCATGQACELDDNNRPACCPSGYGCASLSFFPLSLSLPLCKEWEILCYHIDKANSLSHTIGQYALARLRRQRPALRRPSPTCRMNTSRFRTLLRLLTAANAHLPSASALGITRAA